MLSDGYYYETKRDQECLKANDVLSAISDQEEQSIISKEMDTFHTDAGMETEYYSDLGLDVKLLEEREVEYGSKALLYSYTDKLFIVVYYNDFTDRYQYSAFNKDDIEAAIDNYLLEF